MILKKNRSANQFKNFPYRNILVTGGCGFIGSHLIEALLKLDVGKIIVPFWEYNSRSYFWQKKLYSKVILIQADIRNFTKVKDIVSRHEIDFIFHLAAQTIVETAYYNPLETLETNIMGTVNILETVRIYPKIKGVIVASSDKAYGKKKGKYKETDALKGDHPYEVSKSAADLISSTYFKTYALPVVVTRFGNVYGEGDLNYSRIIPGIMRSLLKNEVLQIRSDGTFVRNYIYVKDVVNGYLLLLENIDKVKGEAFNFGSDEEYSVVRLIKLVEKTLKKKIDYKILNIEKNEIPYQALSFSKIKKTFDWRSKHTISATIAQVYNWYRKILL